MIKYPKLPDDYRWNITENASSAVTINIQKKFMGIWFTVLSQKAIDRRYYTVYSDESSDDDFQYALNKAYEKFEVKKGLKSSKWLGVHYGDD